MFGVIRKRDILAHPFVTVECFGWPLFFRALTAGRHTTFLSLLAAAGETRPPAFEVPELLGHCVQLEERAQRIYESLAERFGDREPVRRFFEALSRQEQEHHEMLQLCRSLAGRDGWLEDHFAPWRDAVPRLERQMGEIEDSLESIGGVADALRLAIRIEGSEINRVFRGAVAATDSRLVRTLRAFQTAEAKHIDYVSDRIPKLEPALAAECGDLRAAYRSAGDGSSR